MDHLERLGVAHGDRLYEVAERLHQALGEAQRACGKFSLKGD